jgi:hypothetical protein
MSGRSPRWIQKISRGTPLGDIEVGTLIKLNENSSPVEFYVAKHDYESTLNGAGRTLLVRKTVYDMHQFGTHNTYADSVLDVFFNGTYLALLDATIQTAAGTTKFYYTVGGASTALTTLERAVFQLSITELGLTASNMNAEGSALPIANSLKIATNAAGAAVKQWSRTPYPGGTRYVRCLYETGALDYDSSTYTYGSRPALTLPDDVAVDKDMLIA